MTIEIRHAEPEDIEQINTIYQAVFDSMNGLPYASLSGAKKRFEDRPKNVYTLVAQKDNKVVGVFSLYTNDWPRQKHVAKFGVYVDNSYQGLGIGSALLKAGIDFCFNWLNIIRLELEVNSDNERAIALYKKFGFEKEGVLRKSLFRNGKYIDNWVMSLLKD